MNKQKMFQLLYVILIVGVLAFMIWMTFWLKSESAMCLNDPITYYTNKVSEVCYCSKGGSMQFTVP